MKKFLLTTIIFGALLGQSQAMYSGKFGSVEFSEENADRVYLMALNAIRKVRTEIHDQVYINRLIKVMEAYEEDSEGDTAVYTACEKECMAGGLSGILRTARQRISEDELNLIFRKMEELNGNIHDEPANDIEQPLEEPNAEENLEENAPQNPAADPSEEPPPLRYPASNIPDTESIPYGSGVSDQLWRQIDEAWKKQKNLWK